MLKWDGHTHTQFCYHGSDAPIEQYVERAIALGFQRYSVTEHPSLPIGWVNDRKLFDELGMPEHELEQYFQYVMNIKRNTKKRLKLLLDWNWIICMVVRITPISLLQNGGMC